MTERLYYNDCYLAEFDAQAISVSGDGLRVVLDRSAFYPTSGGQLFDLGTLGGSAVVEHTGPAGTTFLLRFPARPAGAES